MRARQPLTVRVDDGLTLDAGCWEEVPDGAGGLKRLVHPPQTTLFDQVLEHLSSVAEPVGRQCPTRAEEAIAATAVCLRWGSYLAVLADRDKPPWRDALQERTSRISDSEMARINVEASAALERWIELFRNDCDRYVALALASRRLPMTRRHAPRSDDGEELLLLLHPGMAGAVATLLDSEGGRRAQAAEDAVYDLKAVNPNAQLEEDTRTPEELIDLNEAKGREVAAALAELRGASGGE